MSKQPNKSSIAIFKNTKGALPNAKYAPSDYNGKITLIEPLPAGEYEAAIYVQTSPNGVKYMKGNIRPAWKAKQVGGNINHPIDTDFDEIPF